MSEEKVEIVKRSIAAVNRRDLDAYAALITPDFELIPAMTGFRSRAMRRRGRWRTSSLRGWSKASALRWSLGARQSRASRVLTRPDSAGLHLARLGSNMRNMALERDQRPITQIYEGTNEIQRLVIARTLK
jgi:alkylation response protein AidB-like acyl-CoA dehydrogenase